MSELQTKICSRCGQEKPLEKYSKNNFCKDGRLSICKDCKRVENREIGLRKAREKKARKVCSKCGQEKPLDEFSKNSKAKDGLTYWCKACQDQFRRNFTERRRLEGELFHYSPAQTIKHGFSLEKNLQLNESIESIVRAVAEAKREISFTTRNSLNRIFGIQEEAGRTVEKKLDVIKGCMTRLTTLVKIHDIPDGKVYTYPFGVMIVQEQQPVILELPEKQHA